MAMMLLTMMILRMTSLRLVKIEAAMLTFRRRPRTDRGSSSTTQVEPQILILGMIALPELTVLDLVRLLAAVAFFFLLFIGLAMTLVAFVIFVRPSTAKPIAEVGISFGLHLWMSSELRPQVWLAIILRLPTTTLLGDFGLLQRPIFSPISGAFAAVSDILHPFGRVQLDELVPRAMSVPAIRPVAGVPKMLQADIDASDLGRDVVGVEAAAAVFAILRNEKVFAQPLLYVSQVDTALGCWVPRFWASWAVPCLPSFRSPGLRSVISFHYNTSRSFWFCFGTRRSCKTTALLVTVKLGDPGSKQVLDFNDIEVGSLAEVITFPAFRMGAFRPAEVVLAEDDVQEVRDRVDLVALGEIVAARHQPVFTK